MNKKPLIAIVTGLLIFTIGAVIIFSASKKNTELSEKDMQADTSRTSGEDEWKSKLSPEAYAILREGGTETPYSSPLNGEKRPGTYYAADTGEALFRSEDKFDSGTGWSSFTRPIKEDVIQTRVDTELFMERTEVLTTAGGYLGHVFTDGPAPTGLRYCMNGAALRFVPDEEE